MELFDKLQKAVKTGDIRKNEILAPWTSWKIGGPARYFALAEKAEEAVALAEVAIKNDCPYFILGGGSNLLVSDEGFDGLVIKLNNNLIKIEDNKIRCGAGASLGKLVGESLAKGLTGLEWAAGIPGTIGGAICNNAGAYGSEMADSTVELLVWQGDKVRKMKKADCGFGYRASKFKINGKKEIILSATLQLVRGETETAKQKVKQILKQRKDKIPTEPSAGSVFKNVAVDDEDLARLQKEFSDLPETIKKAKIIPAGYLIDQLSLKGQKIGGVMISLKHAGFIVNTGGAKATDVIMLISIIKQKVRDNLGLQLQEEVEYLGF